MRGIPVRLNLSAITADYVAGRSLRDLALQHDSNPRTLARHLRKIGVELRPPNGPTTIIPLDVDVLQGDYSRGLSTLKIGQAVGVSPGTVANRLRPTGQLRKRGRPRKN